ncbi:ExeM/NucH family extracellular endonuclease [Aquincola sp. J276]|uniref:ExeM/NucH family extracellular endonuclease n=1 Tax=Aquincola sp. J276 TaxID=2898432 RepID=UPI0021518A47|nr:ExeM/NucH family extracellular endonuclease [Aquincola sp. J276]MCR5864332.1 ExeM/NucH family extracellular endonuclease [Aquincola sp. J276]
MPLTLRGLGAAGLAAACVLAQAADRPIAAIQGSGAASPLQGQVVSTTGVVTAVLAGSFHLQDPVGDGDARTSEGLQVHARARQGMVPGMRVRVTGRVVEWAPRGAAPGTGTTQLDEVSGIELLGPAPRPVEPLALRLPLPAGHDLERHEGMLVRLLGPLTVLRNDLLGRYGQLTLAAGGRQQIPTDLQRPGPAALRLARQQAALRIVLDDGRSSSHPSPVPFLHADGTLRAGETTAEVVGVLDQGPIGLQAGGAQGWRLQAVQPPVFQRPQPRPGTPPAVGGELRVASFNLLNYFTRPNPQRGADNAEELARQQAKLVAALQAIGADVLGLMEIENQPQAPQHLADALNAVMGAGTYAAVPQAAFTGTDAIQVALLYRPARLRRLGAPATDADPVHHRPPLAQRFQPVDGGEPFTVIVNHFKSKRCGDAQGADADQADGQGCFNARRVAQARALAGFVQRQGPQALVIGDLNAYAQEDPLQRLRQAGLVDLLQQHAPGAHTYVHDGAAGRLDHALASPALAPRVAGAAVWHINADEPALLDYNLEGRAPGCSRCAPDAWRPDAFRSSDHDPVIVGLRRRR